MVALIVGGVLVTPKVAGVVLVLAVVVMAVLSRGGVSHSRTVTYEGDEIYTLRHDAACMSSSEAHHVRCAEERERRRQGRGRDRGHRQEEYDGSW